MSHTQSVVAFTVSNADGSSILNQDRVRWATQHSGRGFGPIVKYSWSVEGVEFSAPANLLKCNWNLLPDASGFITFESTSDPNNCALLDAYGREKIRLTVPWQLTIAKNPASNAHPTHFVGISGPYVNPLDGTPGQFGVEAWVEFGGEYYFELDWRTGNFLWGKEIRV